MKTILLALSAASLFLASTSCETLIPIDPNTGVRSCGMLPDKPSCCSVDCDPCCSKGEVNASK